MIAANDKGPARFLAQRAVDLKRIADHFDMDVEALRPMLLELEDELSEELYQFALEFAESILEFEVPEICADCADGPDGSELYLFKP